MPTELTAYNLRSSGLSGGKRKPTTYSLFGSSDSDNDTPNNNNQPDDSESETGIELTTLARDVNALQISTDVIRARVNTHNNRLGQLARLGDLENDLNMLGLRLIALVHSNPTHHIHHFYLHENFTANHGKEG